jgi:hypothetical protein
VEPLELVYARELAEEIRSNTKLRHRLNMDEGSESELVTNEDGLVGISFTDRNGIRFGMEIMPIGEKV